MTNAADAPVSSRSNGVPLCGATTSSHAHEPPAGCGSVHATRDRVHDASAVDTSPYRAASGTSRRSTHGCSVNERDTT